MNNKIKFLENAKKKTIAMPEDNANHRSNNANQNNAKLYTSFFYSSSKKIDPKKYIVDAITSNTIDKNAKNVANNPRMDL